MLDPFFAMGVAALISGSVDADGISLADLSFVLPVTDIGYVIAVFLRQSVPA
jgi:hypothetical protein